MDSHRDANEAVFADPTRRTYLAQERTLLAWWRTALGTVGLAIAIGSILPKLTHHPKGAPHRTRRRVRGPERVVHPAGAYRQRTNEHALAERRYLGLKPGMVTALTVYITALVVATCWVLYWGPG
jgi:uncharacterized membrane protein YidH (DUF202 family)